MARMPPLVLVSMLLLAPAWIGGCGMTITPPADVSDPVSVFIADHGIHTSLLLPRDDGRIAQFAYSQWHWAALDQDQWYRSPFALLIPNDGTLGRRDFPGPCDYACVHDSLEKLGRHPPMQALYEVRVERAAAAEVLAMLDARWESQANGNIFNERRGLTFVRDATRYSLAHNCNHEVASWVRALGCRVSGAAMTADVTVRNGPRGPAAAAQSTRAD
ncbi:MAG: hypothetical protein KF699_00410 [Phycisphaeraceae bacterium]|nr:hypothetical protein [Phycisphaeraceae bacterium]MBX3406830.1 hypothetical protein [Phycisphaeraceae bacterium]